MARRPYGGRQKMGSPVEASQQDKSSSDAPAVEASTQPVADAGAEAAGAGPSAPNFSIVIIARNEEERLGRNLTQPGIKAFLEAGGDVLIADTGSTDKTMEVARSHGARAVSLGTKHLHTLSKSMAKMINDKFIRSPDPPLVAAGETFFDFGAARNDAHKHALCDMVLQIDTGDLLEVLDWRTLSRHIADGVTRFSYWHYLGAGHEHQRINRFYDRRIDEWSGCSHEAVAFRLKPKGYKGPNGEDQSGQHQRCIDVPTSVIQVRYIRAYGRKRPYSIGMAIDLMKNPKDPRWYHYLGREMTPEYTNRPTSAIALLEAQGDMEHAWTPERSQSVSYAGQCWEKLCLDYYDKHCKKKGCWDAHAKDLLAKAKASYWRAHDIDPTRREPLIRLADLYRKLAIRTEDRGANVANWQAILSLSVAALQIPNTTMLSENEGNYRHVPFDNCAYALSWLGRWEEAKYHHQKCLEYEPWNQRYKDEAKLYEQYTAKPRQDIG